MSHIFYILGELLIITGGVLCVLVYGGFYKIKYKTEAGKEKFEALKKRRGNLYVILGCALILYGVYNILVKLIN